MVPSASVFFEEVRVAYSSLAARLRLSGPDEAEDVMPTSTYKSGHLSYVVGLNWRSGSVGTRVYFETDSALFTVDVEALAMAAKVVEKRGGFSRSARSLKQMKKSLAGQAEYVGLVHPMMSTGEAEALMRAAGAREWM